uniref:Uncharacterized protein n=1 Tax=Daphnia magna TaxID=35525 RepID=A0A0P6AEC6_9CRUS
MAFPRHQGDSGWLMPEGFHQLLRRYLWLSGFSHINLQVFRLLLNCSFHFTHTQPRRLLKLPQPWKFVA